VNDPKILVVGRHGQLARSLAERAPRYGLELAFAGRPELDLESAASIRDVVSAGGATVIINAAAYTAVDQAEDEPERAAAINATAPAVLADVAAATGAALVHISTDYVFDGRGERPWTEDDPTGPASVYGRTKLAGEEAIRQRLERHAIVRTAWVFSPFGKNFVKTMLALAETRPELSIVGDQFGNPTSALDLADGLLRMAIIWRDDPDKGLGRTYHLAGTGSTNWADFAREIFAQSAARGGPRAEVRAIATADWPAKAQRPQNSRLKTDRFAATFGYRPPAWQESLSDVLAHLLPPH